MKRKTRRMLTSMVTMAFMLSIATTAMAAGPGMGGGGGRGNPGSMLQPSSRSQGGMSSMQADQFSPGGMPGGGFQGRPEGNPGFNFNGIDEAIAGLSEEDQTTLSDYIDAYETAVTAEQEALENAEEGDDLSSYREAVKDALEALVEAADEAEIDLGLTDSPDGSMNNGSFENKHGSFSAAVEEAITGLSEEDQTTLSDYIDAYETAVTAEQEAIESAEEGDDLSSYREAVMDAFKALVEAADEAEIDLGLTDSPDGSINNGSFENKHGSFGAVIEEVITGLSEDDQATLSDYIDAFETALTAEQEALESAEEGDDLSSYREAVMDAVKDLFEAAKEAGIDLSLTNTNE